MLGFTEVGGEGAMNMDVDEGIFTLIRGREETPVGTMV